MDSELKKGIKKRAKTLAKNRDTHFRLNSYYHEEIARRLKYYIPKNSTVLEIGCGTGSILNKLQPRFGLGIDIGLPMVSIAQKKYGHLSFACMDAEELGIRFRFDYIVIIDTIGFLEDIQKAFRLLHSVVGPLTRVIIVFHNFLWQPILTFAEWIRLKMFWKVRLNWLDQGDVVNLLHIEGYDAIVREKRLLLPVAIPHLSNWINAYIAPLPGLYRLCLSNIVIARQCPIKTAATSVSIVIPARNEAGNIEEAVIRIPEMGTHTEIVFVEGNSTDSTREEIKRVMDTYKNKDIKYITQKGTGKANAVREGFALAREDILMILDADLTVAPEELPKFYKAIVEGRGEFINGSRLVYPLEKDAMQLLNMFANKFFSIAFSWILGQRIKDTLCGTKVLHKAHWKKIEKNRSYFGDFDPFGDFDLIFGAAKLGLKFIEIPIRYHARHYGVTNISRFKQGWLLFKMLLIGLRKIKWTR